MEISEQSLSRMMADAVARISRDAQGPSVSRMEATVVSVASDGSMTLNRGTTERPQMLYGVRSLTSAAGAASGDIAVVETFDHVSYVIGIVATRREHYPFSFASSGSSVVCLDSGGSAVLMSGDAYATEVGRSFSPALGDVCVAMNGDRNAVIDVITIDYGYGNLYVHAQNTRNGLIRVNWVIAFSK